MQTTLLKLGVKRVRLRVCRSIVEYKNFLLFKYASALSLFRFVDLSSISDPLLYVKDELSYILLQIFNNKRKLSMINF